MEDVASHWPIMLNLLAGSLLGASWAARLRSETLYRIISVLLLVIAAVLLLKHDGSSELAITSSAQIIVGVIAGLGIGLVASLLGVAGGEFLIPTLILPVWGGRETRRQSVTRSQSANDADGRGTAATRHSSSFARMSRS